MKLFLKRKMIFYSLFAIFALSLCMTSCPDEEMLDLYIRNDSDAVMHIAIKQRFQLARTEPSDPIEYRYPERSFKNVYRGTTEHHNAESGPTQFIIEQGSRTFKFPENDDYVWLSGECSYVFDGSTIKEGKRDKKEGL